MVAPGNSTAAVRSRYQNFAKLAYFGGYFEKDPECKRIFRDSSLNSYNILGEQFANYANSSRTVSLKATRTIMNTGYANSSQTLFEQLFANKISETQTPVTVPRYFSSRNIVLLCVALRCVSLASRCVALPGTSRNGVT